MRKSLILKENIFRDFFYFNCVLLLKDALTILIKKKSFSTMIKSSFNGIIDEIPGISVDNFERADAVQARAYFLSHCHSDHTQGLFSKELIETLEKTQACLYMSEPTAAIIEDENNDERLLKYIKILPLGRNTVILPPSPSQNLPEMYLTVTLITAAHSFGSVMFLFQTTNKSVLFTGDFRISNNSVSKYTYFHDKNGDVIHLDALYVDTTFLGCRYENFPKRSETVNYMIDEIRNWLKADSNMIALHTSAKYGYEFVFNEIYKQLGLKVYVPEDRWRLYSKLSDVVPGVTNEEARIHICRNSNESKIHTKCMKNCDNKKFLYIHFSAMKWSNYEIDSKCINKVNENRLDVCFATHCSKSEVLYFINYFSPKKVVGFPIKYDDSPVIKESCNNSVKSFRETRKRECSFDKKQISSKSLKSKKVDKVLLRKIFDDGL